MKIFMATMGLDIGGAETHIVELAKALQERGHQVSIASAGGVFVAEIEEAGVVHHCIPMNSRNLGSMLSAKGQLKALILKEKPDIVHAHARIPAFLCGQLQKKLKFPFVTTAHGVYSTQGILRYITNWGQHTLAVSQDIQDYLQQAYHLAPQHISQTINGVDTEKFAPSSQEYEALRQDLGIVSQKVLCHVCRLDKGNDLVAEQLISLGDTWHKEGIQVLLVGAGNRFQELSALAEAGNQRWGAKVLVLAGARSDVGDLLQISQLFVGVSRAALEAMAVELPVVLAGAQGFGGLFQADLLPLAVESNFCFRGNGLPQESQLCQEILKGFALTPSQRQELGALGRALVQQSYSVERMTQDVLHMYEKVPRYRLVMSGYYGFDNAGDDAILQAIHQHSSQEGKVEITVLSNNPKETAQRYGVTAIPRFHVGKVIQAVWESDALLSGGGSLLQDRTSTRSILYYLWVISLGKALGKPVMLYANGIGPVTKQGNRRRVVKAVEGATVVTLRDKDSREELRSMGVQREDLHITADPVQAMVPAPEAQGEALLKQAGVTGEFVSISVREWGDMEKFTQEFALFCDTLVRERGLQVVFVLMQPARDLLLSQGVQGKMQEKSLILDQPMSPDLLMAVLGKAKFCVAMRLHTLIFSARMGVPLLGLVYDPKVASYLRETEMPLAGSVEEFSHEFALQQAEMLLADYPAYVKKLQAQGQRLEEQAQENYRLLLAMLEGA